jgi:hypothetical protein
VCIGVHSWLSRFGFGAARLARSLAPAIRFLGLLPLLAAISIAKERTGGVVRAPEPAFRRYELAVLLHTQWTSHVREEDVKKNDE